MKLTIGVVRYFNPVEGYGFVFDKKGEKFYFHTNDFCELTNTEGLLKFCPREHNFSIALESVKVAFSVLAKAPRKSKCRVVEHFCTLANYLKVHKESHSVNANNGVVTVEERGSRVNLTWPTGMSKFKFKELIRAEEARLVNS